MTPTEARRVLRTMATRLDRVNAQRDELYARRRQAFVALQGDGMTQAAIAELAGCKVGDVSFAMLRARELGEA